MREVIERWVCDTPDERDQAVSYAVSHGYFPHSSFDKHEGAWIVCMYEDGVSDGEDYTDFVLSILKPGAEIAEQLSPARAHLTHMALGVAGEAGEVVDVLKKHTMYNQPLDRAHLVEELGDMEFYLESIRTPLGISREEVLKANSKKLAKRYSKGYSDKAAKERADKQDGE